MRFLIFLATILLSIGTISHVFGEEYSNEQFGYKLEYPDNWELEHKMAIVEENFTNPEGKSWTTTVIYANIVDDGYADLGNVPEFAKVSLPLLRIAVYPNTDDLKGIATQEYEDTKNSEYIDHDIVDFKDTSGEIFIQSYLLTSHYGSHTNKEIFTTNGTNVFGFHYGSPDELFDVYEDDFQNVIKSIEFVQ